MTTAETARPRLLRIGVLGCARIAREFIDGVAPSAAVAVTAVASREPARARQFAADHGVAVAYGSYEQLLASPDIDAIYNPLPNALHAAWSIRALEAGKHVLCEKPLAISAAEVRAMQTSANRHGLHLVEAFPYRAQPHARRLRELLVSGAIGVPQTVHAAFGFTMQSKGNIRLAPELGGGALLDAGTYPVSLVRLVAGERPRRVQAAACWDPSGIDRTLVATLEHASGLLAQVSCSFATIHHRHAVIAGSAGSLETGYANNPPLDRPVLLRLRRGTGWDAREENVELAPLNGFRAEAESFAALVREGPAHWSGATPAESLDIAATLDAIIASARSGRAVEIADPSPAA